MRNLLLASVLLVAGFVYIARNSGGDLMDAPPTPVPPSGVRRTQERVLSAVTPAVLATTSYQLSALGVPDLATYMTARRMDASDQMAGVLAVDVEFRSRFGLSE